MADALRERIAGIAEASWFDIELVESSVRDWRNLDEYQVELIVDYELCWRRPETPPPSQDYVEIARRQARYDGFPERINVPETLTTRLRFARWNSGWRLEHGDVPLGRMVPREVQDAPPPR